MSPITFSPLYMDRVWGGRKLETTFQRNLPDAETPFGESWEMVDREEAQSVVDHGTFKGKTLNELWNQHREEIFGSASPDESRFPLLIKILDAADDLSVQVHPPADIAPLLDGEPKTEIWYIAHAEPEAKLYVGVKEGITKEQFEAALEDGSLADCVHTLYPKSGDSIFIPSGRLHAIGAGLLIFEIQQNSDTTYRVYDWNRMGLDGKPRQLHIKESMQCIDFSDIEPPIDQAKGNTIAHCEHFSVEKFELCESETIGLASAEKFAVLSVVEGELQDKEGRIYNNGQLVLLPKGASPLTVSERAVVLRTT